MSTRVLETIRYYSRGRHIPVMFGRFHDGTPIPGGPYTSIQFIGGVGVFIFLWKTMGLWGSMVGGGLTSIAFLLLIPAAMTFALRSVPLDARNPISAGFSAVTAYFGPSSGRLRGRPVRIRRPTTARARITVSYGPAPSNSGLSAGPTQQQVPHPNRADSHVEELQRPPTFAWAGSPRPRHRPEPAPEGASL